MFFAPCASSGKRLSRWYDDDITMTFPRMKHPTEDQLILYHYGEGGGHSRVEQHLLGCESCRAAYQTLERVLAAVSAAPVPERGDAYGAEVWQRLKPRLDHGPEPAPERRSLGWLAWLGVPSRRPFEAAAMAALLLAAFLAGRYWQRPAGPAAPPQALQAQHAASQVRERILLVAVGDHLDRSQMVLVELINSSAGTPNKTVDISAEQDWAEELVDANRLYRQTAAGAGKARVASVLDELERTLLEIAHSPSQVSQVELDDLRRRIEARGILFKVRVVGTQLRQQERAAIPEAAKETL